MRVCRPSLPVILVLLLAPPALLAQDALVIGGLARTGAANGTITVPVFVRDVIGTLAGRDQVASSRIANVAFRVTFSDPAKVAGCDVAGNCTFVEAGILADVRPVGTDDPATAVFEPCAAADTGCFFRSVATTAGSLTYILARRTPVATTATAVPGDLIGYLRIRLSPAFSGTVDVQLDGAGAFLGGTDNASAETVANALVSLDPTFPQVSVLDIDAAGGLEPLTDGLLILRALFGFSGSTLVNGATRAGAQRSGGTEVGAYITSLGTTIDVDGDGTVQPLTDGLLILRYLFGFRGQSLIGGAVAGGATRTSAADIEAFLGAL